MKQKVLFLCTGNSCRSQMAEAYGKKFFSHKYDFYSAGIEKHGLNPFMIKVLKEDGINTSFLYSKTLDDLVDINFNYVITLCNHANETCPLYLKEGKIFHVGFEDPAKSVGTEQDILNNFIKVRDNIKKFIQYDFENILNNLRPL